MQTRLIHSHLDSYWLYETTGKTRRGGDSDCPGDMVWLRLLGECDASGRVFDDSLAGGSLSPFTPLQVERMAVVQERRAAA